MFLGIEGLSIRVFTVRYCTVYGWDLEDVDLQSKIGRAHV